MLKYYLCLYLLLYLIQSFAQSTLIAKQGFEKSGDNWPIETFSTPPCTEQDDTWNYTMILGDILPSEGNYFWGIKDLNGNCGSSGFEYIEFSSYDIAEFRNVVISFEVLVKGYDNGDDMKYEVWFDGNSQGETLFIDGQNDLSYDQWKNVSIEVPNSISSIKLRISIKQNGSDIGGLDNIRLEGDPLNPCSELMISEYAEGSSSTSHKNNFIELYNPREQSLDLSEFKLVKFTGSNIEPSATLQLTGILEPFATYLIEDNTETLSVDANLSTNSAVMDFNGDDKIALQKSEKTIDLIGQIGDAINFGKDVTLRRKSQVKNPNNEFNNEEWDLYGLENIDNLGAHSSYCQGDFPEIEIYGQGENIEDGSASSSLVNNSYFGAWPVVKDTLIQRSFTIKNTGNKTLDISEIFISGIDSNQFSTDFESMKSVAPNDSIQFVVNYKPQQTGIQTAKVEIVNTDPSENPFEFMIQGEGTGPVSHPLIISQYYEGSANNKWMEITNISNDISPENTYYLALFRNEATQHPIGIKPSSKKLIPAIPPGQSIKYSASLNVTAPAYALNGDEIKTAVCNFTGDDILIISTSGTESCWAQRTDIIGSSTNWGSNLSMIRKYGCDAVTANTGFKESDWLIYSNELIDMAEVGSNLRIGIHNSGSTSWKNGSWTNGDPDSFRKAYIESNYSTAINGSIEACTVHILSDANLSISANEHVKIHKDFLVEGTLDIDHEGTLVMVDDQGTTSASGTIRVHKTTTELNPFDYTYWSSPVQTADLESVFWNSPKNSFHYFSTKDFMDLDHDGSDDDNNAWIRTSGTMEVGRGYTSMAPDTSPFLNEQKVIFTGIVNSGVIEIPIYAEAESNINRHYWNLIGNPYPSAIDAKLLLNHPSNKDLLTGTLYFWTHSTPLFIDEASGIRSYTSDDYAMYTLGTGGIKANQNGVEPTQYISSCQGFFVEALQEGLIIFDNNMRTTSHNDNFFKLNTTKKSENENKIWLNLTTREGAFSQILIGFINGATTKFDTKFDGLKLNSQNPLNFYSLIEGQPFAIQGLPEYTGDEKIKLGLNSKIHDETLLKISIDHLEGDFTETHIILHDKLLNTDHNLSVSDYTFKLDQAQSVNQRFELVFKSSIIKQDISLKEKTKIIWQRIGDMLQISTSNKDIINRLEIFDLNGRKLEDQTVNSDLTIIKWLGFPSRGIYVLRARLADSSTIVTKIIP